ncbi:MAG: hypothetical protein HC892_02765 [Saprospiraceae bacterium]|nr:hypothetical protein [Saprospiraceae bacterium]
MAMTKVKGWLELYLWMNEERQVEIKTNLEAKPLSFREKRSHTADLKQTISPSRAKNNKSNH